MVAKNEFLAFSGNDENLYSLLNTKKPRHLWSGFF